MSNKLLLPTLKKEIARPWFLPDTQSLDDRNKLLGSTFYLVKQGDTFGERLRCSRCNNRHGYITLMCIERPFPGLINGLWAYYSLINNTGLVKHLSPDERARYDAIQETLGQVPDLSSMHPETARTLSRDIGPDAFKLGAVSIGVLEGIAAPHAFKLVQRINDEGLKPKLQLGGFNTYEAFKRGM